MITFIIPTIGRDTLEKSIESILNQTNPNWKLIIIFDGIKSTISISNPKIEIIEISKTGEGINSAGNVRNKGIKYVKTEWVGFLDDDDTIANDYVETFYNEINNYPNIDTLIFRMYNENKHIIYPFPNSDNFYEGDVGISFVVKTQIFDKIKFTPSGIEDFIFLDELRKKKYIIMISPHIKYFVNGLNDSNKMFEKCNRVIINNVESFQTVITHTNTFDYIWFIGLFMIFLFFLLIQCFTPLKIINRLRRFSLQVQRYR
jgi:glycosyltransferase involved in cell wall biosynthesis